MSLIKYLTSIRFLFLAYIFISHNACLASELVEHNEFVNPSNIFYTPRQIELNSNTSKLGDINIDSNRPEDLKDFFRIFFSEVDIDMKNVKPKNNPEFVLPCVTDIDYNISNCIIYDKNNIPVAAYSKVNLENKQKIIDKEIQRVDGYINLISLHLSVKELENDSDIQNYKLMIKELKELRQSIKASMSESKVKQLANQIQEKYFPEDAGWQNLKVGILRQRNIFIIQVVEYFLEF